VQLSLPHVGANKILVFCCIILNKEIKFPPEKTSFNKKSVGKSDSFRFKNYKINNEKRKTFPKFWPPLYRT
jgi:hypothetical protein